MEILLRKMIIQNVPKLNNQIYPTNAPETYNKPYIVYYRANTNEMKTLAKRAVNKRVTYHWNIMTSSYNEMIEIRNLLENMLIELENKKIDNIFIEEIKINNIHETYEFNLKLQRGIIDFTIYYEEV